MSNIKILKKWVDQNILELEVEARSEYVSVKQRCYIQDIDLVKNGLEVKAFSYEFNQGHYIEFGSKTGNFTSAFSLEFLPADNSGKIKIEVDMEIADNEERKHRCKFYVNSEIGLVHLFGKKLVELASETTLSEINLNC